jgi:hypothetical protein
MLKTVSSLGADRNIEGMKSKNVWVTVMLIIKTTKINGEKKWNKKPDAENRINATRFI